MYFKRAPASFIMYLQQINALVDLLETQPPFKYRYTRQNFQDKSHLTFNMKYSLAEIKRFLQQHWSCRNVLLKYIKNINQMVTVQDFLDWEYECQTDLFLVHYDNFVAPHKFQKIVDSIIAVWSECSLIKPVGKQVFPLNL